MESLQIDGVSPKPVKGEPRQSLAISGVGPARSASRRGGTATTLAICLSIGSHLVVKIDGAALEPGATGDA